MKIQCDICGRDEASVFCTADEAALCDGCDHHVHHANKLSSKHQRFSLLAPSSEENPLCDICQERRAFLFCQQDRAILCRECDVPIHAANEHTRKHSRFLLAGVKLSASSSVYAPASRPASSSSGCDVVPDLKSQISIEKTSSVLAEKSSSCLPSSGDNNNDSFTSGVVGTEVSANSGLIVSKDGHGSENYGSMSSISKYLIEMLPGWHFEDFLDSCSASFGFYKNDGGYSEFIEDDIDGEVSSFSSDSLGIWFPQSPPPLNPSQLSTSNPQLNSKKGSKESAATLKSSKRWNNDSFAVPEISPSTESKR